MQNSLSSTTDHFKNEKLAYAVVIIGSTGNIRFGKYAEQTLIWIVYYY